MYLLQPQLPLGSQTEFALEPLNGENDLQNLQYTPGGLDLVPEWIPC